VVFQLSTRYPPLDCRVALLLAMTASRHRLRLIAITGQCHRERHRRVAIQKFRIALLACGQSLVAPGTATACILRPSGRCRVTPRNDGTVSSRAPSARGDPEVPDCFIALLFAMTVQPRLNSGGHSNRDPVVKLQVIRPVQGLAGFPPPTACAEPAAAFLGALPAGNCASFSLPPGC